MVPNTGITSIEQVKNIEHAQVETFSFGYRITTNPDEYLIHLVIYSEDDIDYEEQKNSYKWCVLVGNDFDWNCIYIIPRSELPDEAEITDVKDKPEIS